MKVIFIIGILLIDCLVSLSQSLNADFHVSNSICLDEILAVENSSSGATYYEWDFCTGELDSIPSVGSSFSGGFLSVPVGFSVLDTLGFVCSRGNNLIYVYDFSGDINNITPKSYVLSNPLLNGPEWIEVVRDDSKIVCYILNFVGRNIVRAVINDISKNDVEFEDLGKLEGRLQWPRGLELVKSDTSRLLFISDFDKDVVYRVGIANSWQGPLIMKSLDTIGVGTGLDMPLGITLIDSVDHWFGLISSQGNNSFYTLDFKDGLFKDPTFQKLNFATNQPTEVRLAIDGESYFGYGLGALGNFYKLGFGDSPGTLDNFSDLGTFSGDLNNSFGLGLVKYESTWRAFITNYSSTMITRLDFETDCSISQKLSSSYQPQNVQYSAPGKYQVELSAFNSKGYKDFHAEVINVKASTAPDITFRSTNQCVTSSNTFTPTNTSGDITSYSWDFNDDNVEDSDVANPNYTFGSTGDKSVKLTVANSFKCESTISKTIKIYPEPPTTSFTISPQIFCTNNNLTFTNTTSETGYDGLLTYEWYLDDVLHSTTKDVTISFANARAYKVGLRSLLTGCESAMTEQTFTIKFSPTSSFTADTVCLGTATSFTNLSESASGYLWNFGDGSTSTTTNPQHTYTSLGDFVVSLQAQDVDSECPATIQKTVRVNNIAPTPEFEIVSDGLCDGNTISFVNKTNTEGYNGEVLFYWTITDQGQLTTVSPNLTFSQIGMKSAELYTVYRNCTSSVVTKTFEIIRKPLATFTADTVCLGDATTFTNTSQFAVAYLWNFGEGSTSTASSPQHTYTAPGDYAVSLQAFDENSECPFTISKTVRVNNIAPAPDFEIETDAYCDGQVFTFQNLTTTSGYNGEVVFHWTITDLGTTSDTSPQFIFTEPGTKTATLFTTYRTCTSASKTVNFEVFPLPATAFDATSVCLEEPTQFTTQTPGTLFTWDFGDGYQSEEQNPLHFYETYGLFETQLTVTDVNGCIDSITNEVSVSSLPVADFTYQLACEGELVSLEDLSLAPQSDIVAWEWFINDELLSDNQNPEATFSTSGNSTVRLVVYSGNGCSAEYSEQLSVLASPDVDFTSQVGCPGSASTFIDETDYKATVSSRMWYVDGQLYASNVATISPVFDTPGNHTVELLTEQINHCSATLIKSFTVLEPPALDIEVQGVCEDTELLLFDKSIEPSSDPIVSRVWKMDNQVVGYGEEALIASAVDGSHVISLEVITESGCEYSFLKSHLVQNKPTIDFERSKDYGIPPFVVTFTNLSTGASDFDWFINGEAYSSEPNTQFVFEDEGVFEIKLVGQNEFGCTDSITQQVISRLPVMDLQIDEMQLVESGNSYSILARVVNESNIPVEQLEFTLSLENTFELSETLVRRIEVGENALVQLTTGLPVTTDASFLCIRVSSVYPDKESSPVNNEYCLTLDQKLIVEEPYPNPAEKMASVKVIFPEDGQVKITLLDLSGQLRYEKSYPDMKAGLTVFDIDLVSVDSGTYFITIEFAGGLYKSRIIKR